MPDDAVSRFSEIVSRDEPFLSREALTSAIEEALPNLEGVNSLISLIFELELLRAANGWSAEETARAVAAADGGPPDPQDKAKLEGRLREWLGTPSVSVVGKATDIELSHERVFLAARIISEMRPVFSDDAEQRPSAAVVVHILELTYGTQGRDTEVFYVALDEADLSKLGRAVDRARRKDASLRRFLEDSKLPVAGLSG